GTRIINIDVLLFPPMGGTVRVRTSDRAAGLVLLNPPTFQAGSDGAEAPAPPGAVVWPNPIYTDPANSTITDYADYEAQNVVLSFGANECRHTITLVVTNDS